MRLIKDPPTRDFMKWDGTPFKDTAQSRRKKKQNPVTKIRNPVTEARNTHVTEIRNT